DHELDPGAPVDLLGGDPREDFLHDAARAPVAVRDRGSHPPPLGIQEDVVDAPGVDSQALQRRDGGRGTQPLEDPGLDGVEIPALVAALAIPADGRLEAQRLAEREALAVALREDDPAACG